jgi:hypothetical protein
MFELFEVCQLWADSVEKVETAASEKFSQKPVRSMLRQGEPSQLR